MLDANKIEVNERKIGNYTLIDHVARIGLLIVTFYVFIPQIISDIMLLSHGVAFGWVSFYVLLHVLGIALGVGVVAWYNHILMNLAGPVYLFCLGYYMTRYLIDEFRYLMPGVFYLHCFLILILLVNLVIFWKKNDSFYNRERYTGFLEQVKDTRLTWVIVMFSMIFVYLAQKIQDTFTEVILPGLKRIKKSKKFWGLVIGFVVWLSLTSWSYYGFSQKITIEDPGNNDNMRVSFWGYPFPVKNLSYYESGAADEELAFYSQWESSFYVQMYESYFDSEHTEALANFTEVLHYWGDHNISFIVDILPINENGTDDGKAHGDFVTYYYLDEINRTIDLVMDWAQTEGMSNMRGISLDVEGPNYSKDNEGNLQISSWELWEKGVYSFQEKLDEFKETCLGNETFLISMDGILFDFYDNDADLDVKQKTCSVPPSWDYYGYMTYMIGDPSGNYRYYHYMQTGYERHGDDFLPWIGWYSDYDQLTREPEYWESTLDQIKMVKSLGINEVVLAPSRYIIGNFNDYENHDVYNEQMFERLNDINQTINSTFDTFEFNIYHDTRINTDFELYWIKWTPYTYMANSNVFNDLMFEMKGGWLMYVQIAAALGIVGGYIFVLKSKIAKTEKKRS